MSFMLSEIKAEAEPPSKLIASAMDKFNSEFSFSIIKGISVRNGPLKTDSRVYIAIKYNSLLPVIARIILRAFLSLFSLIV